MLVAFMTGLCVASCLLFLGLGVINDNSSGKYSNRDRKKMVDGRIGSDGAFNPGGLMNKYDNGARIPLTDDMSYDKRERHLSRKLKAREKYNLNSKGSGKDISQVYEEAGLNARGLTTHSPIEKYSGKRGVTEVTIDGLKGKVEGINTSYSSKLKSSLDNDYKDRRDGPLDIDESMKELINIRDMTGRMYDSIKDAVKEGDENKMSHLIESFERNSDHREFKELEDYVSKLKEIHDIAEHKLKSIENDYDNISKLDFKAQEKSNKIQPADISSEKRDSSGYERPESINERTEKLFRINEKYFSDNSPISNEKHDSNTRDGDTGHQSGLGVVDNGRVEEPGSEKKKDPRLEKLRKMFE